MARRLIVQPSLVVKRKRKPYDLSRGEIEAALSGKGPMTGNVIEFPNVGKPKPKPKPKPKLPAWAWIAIIYVGYRVLKRETGGPRYAG